MASGAKKKAARRKKEKKASLTNPNPNSDPLPPLHHQGGVEESFETPRWHPDGSGNLSSPEILRSDRKPAAEGSVEIYDSQNLVAYVNDDVFHVMEEEEGSYVFVENPDDHLVGSEAKEKETIQFHGVLADNPEVLVPKLVDASLSLGKEVKIVPWPDEEIHSVDFEAIANGFDVGSKDLMLEKSVTETDEGGGYGLPKIEESLEETNSDELADNPEVDASVSLVKGVKIVPWPYEGMPSVESEAIANGIDVDLKDLVVEKSPRENSDTELDEDEGNVLPEIEESSEGTKLDELAEQNSTLIGQSMFVAEDVSVGSSKVTVEKYTSGENTLAIEVLSQSSKTTAVNLDKNWVGVTDTSPEGREVKVLPLPAEVNGPAARIEFVPRNEVAGGPLVERRATLWNCCGWLDVLIGSER